MNENKPVWKVYRENYNQKCIEEYNIFDHNEFWDMCQIHWMNAHDQVPDNIDEQIERFNESIIIELHYYFWNKCEWEIELTSLFPKDFKNKKISAYSQVALNINVFLTYLWNWLARKELEKNG